MKTYKVLSDYKLDMLVSSVNSAVNDGYDPVGGISIASVYFNDDIEVVDKSEKGAKPGILYVQAVYKSR